MSADIAIDGTLLIQGGIFWASYGVLRVLMFGPYLKLLETREQFTIALKEKAVLKREEAETLRQKYESTIRAERISAKKWGEEQRKKAVDNEKAIMQAARDDVAAKLRSVRERICKERVEARSVLTPKIISFASQIASKVTGQEVQIHETSSAAKAAFEAGLG
jgi:F-type H+-transporting ATPase subunit b